MNPADLVTGKREFFSTATRAHVRKKTVWGIRRCSRHAVEKDRGRRHATSASNEQNTSISSARLYWDTRHNLPAGGFFDARGVKLRVGVSAFAEEIYQAPKSWSEKAYVNLIHYNKFPKGTHFAAWEQTAIFVSEMRATFKSLRSS